MTPPPSTAPFAYAAAVLCGGHSVRMGADKAHLPHPSSNLPLVLHQLSTLAALSPPPVALTAAARTDQSLPPLPAAVTRHDDDGTAGPLGALAPLLTDQPPAVSHVLVLPVDTPYLDAPTLQALVAIAPSPDTSVVARSPAGLQPLVALYARAHAPAFADALAAGRLGLQRLLSSAPLANTVTTVPFADTTPFTNWNRPTDRT
ncbi:NTP transferase domain-containing protein [Actomonas aquatica]|uniref:NTP transferase domain-containing protein n=1 Tax=Actomonas aquatica TaxID=2866162 RepID=A0ABZ1C6A7_9BACT|nr:NTP transferase domain-containing protein [Opitutus sp. WL0086]WRQ87051.1 NTP transferase domain-containing protein [Opitutus sp. WL0086]